MINFDVALLEKEGNTGLILEEIKMLYNFCANPLNNGRDEVSLVELSAKDHESTAIGFITPAAYDKLDWDLEASGFHNFITSIMDDMELEDKLAFHSYELSGKTYHLYEFKGLKIWLNR